MPDREINVEVYRLAAVTLRPIGNYINVQLICLLFQSFLPAIYVELHRHKTDSKVIISKANLF